MLDNIFALSVITSGGANVLLQGIQQGFHSVPLHHHINLKSNVVSGQGVVGVRPTFSIQYISLLFAIDLAGAKVIMDPVVSKKASYEENEIENAGNFPACAVTLATKRPLAEEETLLQGGIIETIDVELKDKFVFLMSTINFYDGDMSRYFIDKEHKSCLDTDED
jgi:hypothetical protein